MYLIRITKEETGETELFGTNTYTSESVDSCIEKVTSGQERRSESVHEAGDHGVERRRRTLIMENEKLEEYEMFIFVSKTSEINEIIRFYQIKQQNSKL
jgi:hypothetical protein